MLAGSLAMGKKDRLQRCLYGVRHTPERRMERRSSAAGTQEAHGTVLSEVVTLRTSPIALYSPVATEI